MIKIRVISDGSSGKEHESGLTRYVLPAVPQAVLQRHGARVLRPAEAAVAKGWPKPNPTIYRYGVLLVPRRLLDSATIVTLNRVLTDVGMRLVRPDATDDQPATSDDDLDAKLPVAVELGVAGTFKPQAVDAWTALQRLRAEVTALREACDSGASTDTAALESLAGVVDAISLDHLLVGSATDGSSSTIVTGTNTASNGNPDLNNLFDRPAAGTSGRIPVTVALADPGQIYMGQNASRRPVVAVLDTGIACDPEHPWLTPRVERGANGHEDAVVIVDTELQKQLEAEHVGERLLSIASYADEPSIEEPLLGDLSTHAGHGTFIAGLIRQLAPGAQIYAVRVMQPDGFAPGSDVVNALKKIAYRVRRAQSGQADGQAVDVVSLSLGYFDESADERNVTIALEPVLRELTELGVTVVAAAGNFATSRKFLPAALTEKLTDKAAAPMISVGSLNPNGSTSRFSNEAPWVTCYASGAAIVSTFPAFAGAQNAPARTGRRESFDPDDFASMFGVWSGTSFAAPVIAGLVAARLHDEAGRHDRDQNSAARVAAAHAAWENVLKDAR
ncbi:Subtilase family protein [Asanoa hainanensis]|uniref:Subtilase family protein n=1 Tax=Asanoa hainanensis TaxID=560556 RepID=A0A239NFZ0_9ACTN|nr:S8 family serine peptidase [Asanoa hainanensis]SNT53785.1 Subtilase family protein [Asanoa hainanensis]